MVWTPSLSSFGPQHIVCRCTISNRCDVGCKLTVGRDQSFIVVWATSGLWQSSNGPVWLEMSRQHLVIRKELTERTIGHGLQTVDLASARAWTRPPSKVWSLMPHELTPIANVGSGLILKGRPRAKTSPWLPSTFNGEWFNDPIFPKSSLAVSVSREFVRSDTYFMNGIWAHFLVVLRTMQRMHIWQTCTCPTSYTFTPEFLTTDIEMGRLGYRVLRSCIPLP